MKQFNAQDVLEIIQNSFDAVSKNIAAIDAKGIAESRNPKTVKIHKIRSSALTKQVTHGLQSIIDNDSQVVFSKEVHNEEFNRSEFLFDIHVCEKEVTQSAVHKSQLPFVKSSIVIIESEFARDTRESMIDLSKLVISKCPLKIMILPLGKKVENYLKPLRVAAEYSDERIHFVFIPHPEKWGVDGRFEVH